MYNDNVISLEVLNCIFKSNNAERGGGIFNDLTENVTIVNSIFDGNTAPDQGGGIYNYYGIGMLIDNCVFSNNSAGAGGGIKNYTTSPMIMNSIFIGNSASQGGGIWNAGGSSIITNCVFDGNWGDSGGGINFGGAPINNPVLDNSVFVNNSSQIGGGIYIASTNITITNCTFSGNSSTINGAGLNIHYNSYATITNSIFSDNIVSVGAVIFVSETSNPSTLNISYSNVQGGLASIDLCTGCTLNWATGMIDDFPLFVNSPLFVDITIFFGTSTTIQVADALKYTVNDIIEIDNDGVPRIVISASGTTVTFAPALSSPSTMWTLVENWGPGATDLDEDFHLQLGSPCIDAADPASTITEDIESNPRPVGLGYDMGAYEYQ